MDPENQTETSWWQPADDEEFRTPLVVVRKAASQLAEITKGLLEGVVKIGSTKSGYLQYELELSAPLISYRYTLLTIVHHPVASYPAWIDADLARNAPYIPGVITGTQPMFPTTILGQNTPSGVRCNSAEEMVMNLQSVLKSEQVSKFVGTVLRAVTDSQEDPIDPFE